MKIKNPVSYSLILGIYFPLFVLGDSSVYRSAGINATDLENAIDGSTMAYSDLTCLLRGENPALSCFNVVTKSCVSIQEYSEQIVDSMEDPDWICVSKGIIPIFK